jgi:hypothetical protein
MYQEHFMTSLLAGPQQVISAAQPRRTENVVGCPLAAHAHGRCTDEGSDGRPDTHDTNSRRGEQEPWL